MTAIAMILALSGLGMGCGHQARMKLLGERRYTPLDRNVPVTVYLGQPDYSFEELAIIDSSAYAHVDEAIKRSQLDELRAKAREAGANLVMDVRILPRRMRGYTLDEQVPFTSWKQGEYELYFMRGVAARAPFEDPGSLSEIAPDQGWLVETRPVPRNLEQFTSGTQTAG